MLFCLFSNKTHYLSEMSEIITLFPTYMVLFPQQTCNKTTNKHFKIKKNYVISMQ